MDTFGLLGFVFGLAGLSFGLMSFEKVNKLEKEIETLKDLIQKRGEESE